MAKFRHFRIDIDSQLKLTELAMTTGRTKCDLLNEATVAERLLRIIPGPKYELHEKRLKRKVWGVVRKPITTKRMLERHFENLAKAARGCGRSLNGMVEACIRLLHFEMTSLWHDEAWLRTNTKPNILAGIKFTPEDCTAMAMRIQAAAASHGQTPP
jgi:hypothetical protein